MLLMFSGTFLLLVRDTVAGTLLVPSAIEPKLKVMGNIVTGTTPMPARLTICGLLLALSVIVTAAALAPTDVGTNVTVTLHIAPAAKVAPQDCVLRN